MNWDKFKENFHESWHKKMKPFVESEECDKLYAYLKKESKRGKQVAPLSSNVWKAFMLTPMDELKFVLMGMCPYHTFKNGLPVADGLMMSCSTPSIARSHASASLVSVSRPRRCSSVFLSSHRRAF